MHQPAYYKRTFYTNLRQYPQTDNYGKRGSTHTATHEERNDIFSKSQNHWNKGFKKEMDLVSQYQRRMDQRLSKPKSLKHIKNNSLAKIFINTNFNE